MTRRSPINLDMFDGADSHPNASKARPRCNYGRTSAIVRPMPNASRNNGNMGGGLRLQDTAFDVESHITAQRVERPISLTGQRIVRGMWCCAILGVLAVAHIQLRFYINDSRLQHQRMQRAHRELLQQYAVLERANAQLSDYDRLKNYATNNMHMVEIQERPTAYVTAEVRNKYVGASTLQAARPSTRTRAVAEVVSEFNSLKGDGILKLVDTGRAALTGRANP